MASEPKDVLELFARYQRRLYSYILSVLPNQADAEDVLQNTNIVVWRKFDQFHPGTDFRAWIFQICYYEICKFRSRQRPAGVSFSTELIDELSVEYHCYNDLLEIRQAALPGCVEQLPAQDRDLMDAVYGREISVPCLAQQMNRKPTSIYRSLRRIRKWLYDCVERAVYKRTEP
ncbi:MAG: sigma-70 family RNA polymerase sigma factor [Planctomycetes bacterium]|nr:sigma-70 family RNA polymerase sigma factor [Planctomycetota bacterium]MCG2682261.1 sigma-70 family RNA polymerase sigma factor [Planctomycetales bacterium]